MATKKPTILLIHGWMQSAASWKSLADDLSLKFNLVVPDLPGFGRAIKTEGTWDIQRYTDFITNIIQKEKHIDAIIGHSLGGIIALSYVEKFPHSVSSLILCDVPIDYIPHLKLIKPLKPIYLPTLKIIQNAPDSIRRRIVKLIALTTIKQYKQISPQVVSDILNANPVVAASLFSEFLQLPSFSFRSANIPRVLVIRGEHDRIISREKAEEFTQNMQGIYKEMKGIGHTPHIEAPEELSQTIQSFLLQQER